MFENRIRAIMVLFVACWVILVFRLVHLQVVQADTYEEQAEALLVRATRYLEPVRGPIVDRNQRVLASDEPSWSVALHFGLISQDSAYLRKLAKNVLRRTGRSSREEPLIASVSVKLRGQVEALWAELARISDRDVTELRDRGRDIDQRVRRIKAGVERYQQRRLTIEEETDVHPIVTGLDNSTQLRARLVLARKFKWLCQLGAVEVVDSRQRVVHGGEVVAHLLGRQGAVQPRDVERRPLRTASGVIDWAGYRASDLIGVSGVEWLAEARLRGRRGMLTTYLDDRPTERTEPHNGLPVRLSIDVRLEQQLYHLLAAVAEDAVIPGGSIVVLDVDSREILAIVSYPSYDPNRLNDVYAQLRLDTKQMPLRFRAVAHQYAPGSIVKPLTVMAALSSKTIDPDFTYACEGSLFPEHPGRWRCWRPAGSTQPIRHGTIGCGEAITGSCNVFSYELGNRLGVSRLCNYLEMVGIGKPPGSGLREERRGILPTPSYLAMDKGRAVRPGDARNYAIGQGELQVTPLQAANLAATYAAGEYRAVRLILDGEEQPTWQLPVQPSTWDTIRRGMYGVTNDERGTAVKHARLDHPDFVLCGKSGSAETPPWITSFHVVFEVDGQRRQEVVRANTRPLARAEFARLFPEHRGREVKVTPASYWPEHRQEGRKHSHAWFIAFLQPKDNADRPDWTTTSRVAIAVLLEFGGSGGRTSGPLCLEVARTIIDDYPQYVYPSRSLTAAQP